MTWVNPKDYTVEQRRKSDELVRRGVVRHLLTPVQRVFYDKTKTQVHNEIGYFCTRKIGKSFSLFLMEVEKCIQNGGLIWRHIFPTFKLAKDVCYPIYRELREVLPDDVMPRLLKSEAAFEFKNGSVVLLGGAHPDSIENARGPIAHGIVLDEAAAFEESNFDYAMYSVLYPQLTTVKNSVVWHATTPPKSPQHPWLIKVLPRLRMDNAVVEATIDDNALLTQEDIAKIEKRYITLEYPNARDNPEFQREYLLKASAATDLRIIPEFRLDRHVYKDDRWAPMRNPVTGDESQQYIGFISVDHGVTDLSHTIVGVLNWVDNTLYILKEHADKNMSLADLAAVHNEMKDFISLRCPEIISIGDLWDQCRLTMQKDHGITFQRPRKAGLEDNTGVTRNAFEQDKIKIHDSCPKLISQLQYGLWAETQATDPVKKFARTEGGHSDGIAALIYLVRRVTWNMRPAIRPQKPLQPAKHLIG